MIIRQPDTCWLPQRRAVEGHVCLVAVDGHFQWLPGQHSSLLARPNCLASSLSRERWKNNGSNTYKQAEASSPTRLFVSSLRPQLIPCSIIRPLRYGCIVVEIALWSMNTRIRFARSEITPRFIPSPGFELNDLPPTIARHPPAPVPIRNQVDVLARPNASPQAFLDTLGSPTQYLLEVGGEGRDLLEVSLQNTEMEIKVKRLLPWIHGWGRQGLVGDVDVECGADVRVVPS